MTLASTLSFLDYVITKLGYKYLLTARLSQDPLENLFGILRQMSGSNDHPTPSQFLPSVNSLSFCSLAKAPANSNILPALVSSLLSKSSERPKQIQEKLNELMDVRNEVLESRDLLRDYDATVSTKSDSRVTYYVAGYVARNMLKKKKKKCDDCLRALLLPASEELPDEACLTKEVDKGGLLRPSAEIQQLIVKLKDSFTHRFCFDRLKQTA